MQRQRAAFAAIMAVVTVLSAFAPVGIVAADDDTDGLSVEVTTDEDPLVEVTQNGSAVENATVDVDVSDANASYDGTGVYTTDENGTVALSAPVENVTVTISATAGDRTAETTTTLEASSEDEEAPNFGSLLEEFMSTELTDEGPLGIQIASFVVANNPGNAPDHAGPPAHAGPPTHDGPNDETSQPADDDENEPGPPAHAQSGTDDRQGPPAHAGPHGDD